ncbi:MAG: hypothetical protein KAT70_03700, partial [Thermoplasmata archaeon]|nr:hypothetical protein [Thermoplasmata archaeon]
MKKMAIFLILAMLLPAIPLWVSESAEGAYFKLQGDITSDEIWDPAVNVTHGAIYLNESFSVNASLTIRDTMVYVNATVSIYVNGTLDADNVTFRINGSSGVRWRGFVYNSGSWGNITGCRLWDISTGLTIASGNIVVNDTIIDERFAPASDQHLVKILSAGPRIENVTLSAWGGNGLFLSATPSDLMISDCVIGNATEGIKLESAASLTLRNCTLTGAQKIR